MQHLLLKQILSTSRCLPFCEHMQTPYSILVNSTGDPILVTQFLLAVLNNFQKIWSSAASVISIYIIPPPYRTWLCCSHHRQHLNYQLLSKANKACPEVPFCLQLVWSWSEMHLLSDSSLCYSSQPLGEKTQWIIELCWPQSQDPVLHQRNPPGCHALWCEPASKQMSRKHNRWDGDD